MNELFKAIQNKLIQLGCKFADRFNEQHKNRSEQYAHETPAGYIVIEQSFGNLYDTCKITIYVEQTSIEDNSSTTQVLATDSEVVLFVEKIKNGLHKWKPLDNSGIMVLSGAPVQDTNYTEYSFWSMDFEVLIKKC